MSRSVCACVCVCVVYATKEWMLETFVMVQGPTFLQFKPKSEKLKAYCKLPFLRLCQSP